MAIGEDIGARILRAARSRRLPGAARLGALVVPRGPGSYAPQCNLRHCPSDARALRHPPARRRRRAAAAVGARRRRVSHVAAGLPGLGPVALLPVPVPVRPLPRRGAEGGRPARPRGPAAARQRALRVRRVGQREPAGTERPEHRASGHARPRAHRGARTAAQGEALGERRARQRALAAAPGARGVRDRRTESGVHRRRLQPGDRLLHAQHRPRRRLALRRAGRAVVRRSPLQPVLLPGRPAVRDPGPAGV